MRKRITSVVIAATVLAALGSSLATAGASTSFKAGTYKAKGTYKLASVIESHFKILLKRGSCAAAPSQGKSSLHLCVSLPVSPPIVCQKGVTVSGRLGSFATPVQLPNSGKLTQHAPVTTPPPIPGAPAPSGESEFSVTFKKNGTANGLVVQRLTVPGTGVGTLSCVTREPFTAKLG